MNAQTLIDRTIIQARSYTAMIDGSSETLLRIKLDDGRTLELLVSEMDDQQSMPGPPAPQRNYPR
jgi:hypothetical protein